MFYIVFGLKLKFGRCSTAAVSGQAMPSALDDPDVPSEPEADFPDGHVPFGEPPQLGSEWDEPPLALITDCSIPDDMPAPLLPTGDSATNPGIRRR